MSLGSMKISKLSLSIMMMCAISCSVRSAELDASKTPRESNAEYIYKERIENRIRQIFNNEDAERILAAHKTYEINVSLIRLVMGMVERHMPVKQALERYEFSPTDQNLLRFFKTAEHAMDQEINKDPAQGDWKSLGRYYGGLSSIVYIHVHNFANGVPDSRNRDHLLK